MKKIISILILSCGFTSLLTSQDTLSVPLIKQIRSQWCWAACAQMIDAFWDIDTITTQCQFVEYYADLYRHNNDLVCPCRPGPRKEAYHKKNGNVNFSLEVEYWGPRYERILSYAGFYSSFEALPTLSEIKSEIRKGCPLIAFVKQSPGMFAAIHMVVVKGYQDTLNSTFLLVNDPWFHDTTLVGSEMINYNASLLPGATKSFLAFQLDIHPKNMDISSPTGSIFRRTSNIYNTPALKNSTIIKEEKDTVSMPINILSIDALRKWWPQNFQKKFFMNDVREVYSPSEKKSYVWEKFDTTWVLTEIKKSNYPLQLTIKKGKNTFTTIDVRNKNVEIWLYPSLPFTAFYQFEYNNKTMVTPLTDFYKADKSGNEKKLEAGVFYSPKKVLTYLRSSNRQYFGKRFFTNLNTFQNSKNSIWGTLNNSMKSKLHK